MDCFRGYWFSNNNSFGLHSGGGSWGLGPKRPKGSCFVIPATSTPADNTKLLTCFDESNDDITEEYYSYNPSVKENPFLKIQKLEWNRGKRQITIILKENQNITNNKLFTLAGEILNLQPEKNELITECTPQKQELGQYRGCWWICDNDAEERGEQLTDEKPKGIKLKPF